MEPFLNFYNQFTVRERFWLNGFIRCWHFGMVEPLEHQMLNGLTF